MDTREETHIASLGFDVPGYGATISSDGQWLLYSKVEPMAADIMLVENFR